MSTPYVWIGELLQHYRRVLAPDSKAGTGTVPDAPGSKADHAITADTLTTFDTLRLAEALVTRQRISAAGEYLPPQIVIIGPTQSGKSTLVNLMLDAEVAGISALAGHTVHARGFSAAGRPDWPGLADVFKPLQQRDMHELESSRLNEWAVIAVEPGASAIAEPAIIWDTPDFDSVAARGYQEAVLRAIGLADVLVLVVSKDKYGDKSVWDLLSMLQPLGMPQLVVINKLDSADEQTVLDAFRTRYTSSFTTTVPPVACLPFVRTQISSADVCDTPAANASSARAQGIASPTRSTSAHTAQGAKKTVALPAARIQALQQALQSAIGTAGRTTANLSPDAGQPAARSPAIDTFIATHRQTWLAPLLAELSAHRRWQAMVESALSSAENDYVTRYLEDPDRYDTFNRALAELLVLLEIPGVATALARTRKMITWPARKLLGAGRRAANLPSRQPLDGQEADVLAQVFDRALTQLQSSLIEQARESDQSARESNWWQDMNAALRTGNPKLESAWKAGADNLQRDFEPRIEAAAERLFQQLQAQPRLLNTLRAARVSADAAGVVLAVKSGGLAPADLILAPAMLSVTTLLTESALGRYLDTIKRELKDEQQRLMRERLLEPILAKGLHELPDSIGNAWLARDQSTPASSAHRASSQSALAEVLDQEQDSTR